VHLLMNRYTVLVKVRDEEEQEYEVYLWFWKKPTRTKLIYNFTKQHKVPAYHIKLFKNRGK